MQLNDKQKEFTNHMVEVAKILRDRDGYLNPVAGIRRRDGSRAWVELRWETDDECSEADRFLRHRCRLEGASEVLMISEVNASDEINHEKYDDSVMFTMETANGSWTAIAKIENGTFHSPVSFEYCQEGRGLFQNLLPLRLAN